MGRDRSASPNYHSLIYGDARKKTDRSQNISDGSNERSEPRSVPGAGGGAVPPLESGDCDFGCWWRGVYSVLYCAWLLDNYYACCLFLPGFCEICQEICVGFARNKCCHI